MYSSIEKRNIMELMLDTIGRMADEQYQWRIWVRGEGPEVDSFDEALDTYSPLQELVLGQPDTFGLTTSQFQSLREYQNKLSAFVDKNDFPELFIDTPEWKEIMVLADKVLDAFGWNKETRKFV